MITTTVTYHDFLNDLQKSDNYRNNFSYEGAKALFEYLEELSEDTGENIEYDPTAWCCEFTEYENLAQAYKQWRYDYPYVEGEAREYFQDETMLIELENGKIIIQDF